MMITKLLLLLTPCFFTSCTQRDEAETKPASKEATAKEETQVLLFDVRSAKEFNTGHLDNAINIPHSEIAVKIIDHVADKNAKITLYCKSGRRAGIAKKALEEIGYTDITKAGAYKDLKEKTP